MTEHFPPNDEDDWTPLRFSIREVLVLTAVLAVFFAVVRALDNDIFFTLMLVLSIVFLWLCLRLLRLGKMRSDQLGS